MEFKYVLFLLIFISAQSFGQKSIFKWYDETCEYESSYDDGQFSEIQINNCRKLTYNYTYRIDNTPSVHKPQDINRLNLDTLNNEYKRKINELRLLELPKIKFWNDLREFVMIELEQTYNLSRIAYQGYLEPKFLKEWYYQDSCLEKHTNALITGGDVLLNDWYELTVILAENNCCPEKVWEKYYTQYDSDNRFIYASVYVTTFGWWNCAIDFIERSDDKIDDQLKRKEFLKLFVDTKTIECDEP